MKQPMELWVSVTCLEIAAEIILSKSKEWRSMRGLVLSDSLVLHARPSQSLTSLRHGIPAHSLQPSRRLVPPRLLSSKGSVPALSLDPRLGSRQVQLWTHLPL